MQNILNVKEVLDSFSVLVKEYIQCEDHEKAELLKGKIGSARTALLKAYAPSVSARFEDLDSKLHGLFRQHLSSLMLSVGELQEIHDTNVRSMQIDTDTFHSLRLTKIHPILMEIDQRLLAMNATLQGMSLVAKRKP